MRGRDRPLSVAKGTPPQPMIAADRVIDAIRDVVAAVRACQRADAEGLHAILTGTEDPRGCLGMAAALAAVLLEFGGATGADADRVLDEARRRVEDSVLDLQHAAGR
jgi:hypothetical protein